MKEDIFSENSRFVVGQVCGVALEKVLFLFVDVSLIIFDVYVLGSPRLGVDG